MAEFNFNSKDFRNYLNNFMNFEQFLSNFPSSKIILILISENNKYKINNNNNNNKILK